MKRIIYFVITILLAYGCQKPSHDEKYMNVDGSAWRLNFIEQDNSKNLVYATYDGRVVSGDMNGSKLQWQFETNAFIFSLTSADLDQDKQPEILAATADGILYVLDNEGKLKWQFSSPLPLYNVAFGNLQGNEKLEIATGGIDRQLYVLNHEGKKIDQVEADRLVHRIAIGNLDEDDYDEIFMVEHRVIGHLLDLEDNQLHTQWRENLSVPQEYVNWENPRGNFYAFSLDIADINQDGNNEILMGDTYFNKQAVMAMDRRGKSLWITEKQPPFTIVDNSETEFYSFAMVKAADFKPEMEGLEIVSVAGGMVKMFDVNGNLLAEANGKVGFTDFILDGTTAYLGSSPNGDQTVYRIDLSSPEWKNQVLDINRTGKTGQIGNNINDLRQQVMNYQPDNNKVLPEYVIKYGNIDPDSVSYQKYLQELKWFKEKFPYDNLKRVVRVKVIEPTPPLDNNGEPWSEWRWSVDAINGTMTVEEIINIAEFIEKHEIPTLFYMGHSCMPFITLETAEKILQTAPNYCYGFITSEDEQIERLDRFFKYYMGPLADLCVEYGYKKLITRNKNLWWMSIPSIGSVYESMFKGERKKVIMAATEDSNSRCPEMNLLGRGGLWQAGLLQNNDVSIHADIFSFCRYHQWEYPKIGHPYLRLMVAHTSLGGTQLSIRVKDRKMNNGEHQFTYLGKESTEILYHMLGKGLVFSPEPEQVRGYNPVGIVVHEPEQKWFEDAHNGHAPEKWTGDTELDKAIIPHNGVTWGMSNTPDYALQNVLLNKERQFGYQVPATPYGLVALVPEHADLDKVAGINDWIHTDGIYVWRDPDQKMTGQQAADFLKKEFSASANQLPFRIEGNAFMQIIETGDDQYRLILVDPGWLDPEDRKISLYSQLDQKFTYKDLLSGGQLGDDKIQVTIPAGTFRILEANANP